MVRSHGPPWTSGGMDMRTPGCDGVLIGAGPLATTEYGSSPTGVEKGEGSMGLRRQCGGRVMVMKRRRKRSSSVAALKLGERE
jgi:hypothetical protein